MNRALLAAEYDVVSRRVNRPSRSLRRVLADATAPDLGGRVALARGAELRFDTPFVAITTWPIPRWQARGRLRPDGPSRAVAVEIELSAWSTGASELRVRPTAPRFAAWGWGRQRRYFVVAHDAADTIVRRLEHAAGPRGHASRPSTFTIQGDSHDGNHHEGNLDRRAS